MKYRVCLFVYILLVNLASANAQDDQQRMTALRSALETYVSSPITSRNHSALNHYSDLLKDHETTIRQWVFELYKTHLGTGHARTEYNRGRSSSGGIVQKDLNFVHYEMPYWFKDFGQKPDKGWPLVIVLHGGGSDKSSNDDQYEAMKTRYQPGIAARNLRYAALRAPTDEYDVCCAPFFGPRFKISLSPSFGEGLKDDEGSQDAWRRFQIQGGAGGVEGRPDAWGAEPGVCGFGWRDPEVA